MILRVCKKKGVVVSNAAGIYGVGMAEFIVYAMLMVAKKYNKSIKNSSIRYLRGYKFISELSRKTVGIMGVGSIGSEVAKRLSAFDMNVLGYSRTAIDKPFFNKMYQEGQLNLFIPMCDYLIVTIPLTEFTKGIFNRDIFALMKSNITIVNVGRQALFNEKDFIETLKLNKDMTAILDVFELLPNPITNPFRRLSNVKVLPGVTAISKEISEKRLKLVVDNAELVMQNQPPKFIL